MPVTDAAQLATNIPLPWAAILNVRPMTDPFFFVSTKTPFYEHS
jgi:hypothetical protein